MLTTRKATLKSILAQTTKTWRTNPLRPEVASEFQKVLDCRTPALGATVYASPSGEERIVYHTCKSRACPSCGQRANRQWLREMWCDLPDVPYWHVVLTMPDAFWALFKQNRHLLHDLPEFGAHVVKRWLRLTYGIEAIIVVLPHTFGKDLKFNSHLHLLVSQGGLHLSSGEWLKAVYLKKPSLMKMWRWTVVEFLRLTYREGLLNTELRPREFEQLLDLQYRKWWHVFAKGLADKMRVLRYAGRYAKRPPIAEHKLRPVDDQNVKVVTKDPRSRRLLEYDFTYAEFIERLSHHIPDRYRHNVRYFGLLAPRTKAKVYDHVFHELGQVRRQRPRRLRWALAIQKEFGVNPLLDSAGRRMIYAGFLAPTKPQDREEQ